jgi:hypothetical protein
MKFGIGTSSRKKARLAAKEAAEEAVQKLGGEKVKCFIIHATANYEQQELLMGINEVAPEAEVVGCSSEGVITQEGSEEGMYTISVLAFPESNSLRLNTFSVRDLKQDSEGAGAKLAQLINGCATDKTKLLLLFPDGLTSNSTAILRGLEGNLKRPLKVAGGTAGDSLQFVKSYQYHNKEVFSDGASAVLLTGDIEIDITVSHGCQSIGIERTITHSEANVVKMIDNKPALEVIQEYTRKSGDHLDGADVITLCLGEKLSPEDAKKYHNDFIIRAPMGVVPGTAHISMAAEIPQGTKIIMQKREAEAIKQKAKECAETIRNRHGAQPALVFQFDCAGRGKLMFGEKVNETIVDPLQNTLGKSVPWIGFHTFGEIAPIGDKNAYHNYSVVLCAIYDDAA